MMQDNIQVLGIGQCGTRIGKEFERFGVDAFYINSDEIDMRGLEFNKKKLLSVDSTGTGGSPVKGAQMFEEHKDSFIKFFKNNVDPGKILIIAAGGGGGTGGGFVAPVTEYSISMGQKTGVLYTLPPQMLGMLAMNNALRTLRSLRELDIKSFILADNEHLIATLGVSENWWLKVNRYIVTNIYHAFDIIRSNKKSNSGFGSIDKGELMRIFQYGKGLLDIRTTYFKVKELNDFDSIKNELKSIIYSPNLMPKFDYKNTLAYIVNIDVPIKGDFNELAANIYGVAKKTAGSSIARLGMFIDPSLNDEIRVTLINAGLKFPKILKGSISHLKRDEERFKTKMEKEDSISLKEIESDEFSIDEEFDI